MQTKTIDTATRAFAEIDFSEENAQIAAIEGRIAEMQKATATAEDRCTAITRELADFRGPSGADVSAALLAGHSPTTAAVAGPSKEALETERASLKEGVRELVRQVEAARQEISNIRDAARKRLIPICEHVADELQDGAIAAVERLIEITAAYEAIALTTKFGWYEAGRLKDKVRTLMLDGAVVPYRKHIPVPVEISTMLQALDGKGAAFPAFFRTSFDM